MKIAVPSNDKLNISNHFFCTKSFKIFTLEKGSIVNEEYRYNNFSGCNSAEKDIKKNQEMIYDLIRDCNTLIVRDIKDCHNEYLQNQNIEIVITDEKIITTAVLNYYGEIIRQESNTCCCP